MENSSQYLICQEDRIEDAKEIDRLRKIIIFIHVLCKNRGGTKREKKIYIEKKEKRRSNEMKKRNIDAKVRSNNIRKFH